MTSGPEDNGSAPAGDERILSPVVTAVLWMIGTLLSFSLMAIAVRELSGEIHSFQIMLFRSLGALVVLAPFVALAGRAAWRTARPGLQVARNSVHFFAQLGWITGIGLLPLAEVFAIEFTTPIWATLLAILFLGERLNRGRIIALAAGFLGILVILRPGVAVVSPGSLAVLGAAFGFAATFTITKILTRTDRPITILLYMSLVQIPMGLVAASLEWTTPDALQLFWLFAVGATGLSAHYCSTRALAIADQTVVIPVDFMRLPLIVAVGALLYGETADPLVLAGALLIFAGNYYSIRRENRRTDRPA